MLGILPLTMDDQGHVLPVRAKGVGHLTGVPPCIPLRRLIHMQAPISPDRVAAAWGYLGMGREQKVRQTRGQTLSYRSVFGAYLETDP